MKRLAIIGSGPSALYLLQNLCRCERDSFLSLISVFERGDELGVGMPYSRATTDRFNICNISSEEIPRLDVSFADWLQSLDKATRSAFGVVDESISPKETYPRVALGGYFRSQWIAACEQLRSRGIDVSERPLQPIADIIDDCEKDVAYLVNERGDRFEFDYVVVATGHRWNEEDRPKEGFYASPWPVQKLLPARGDYLSYTIGTLGASLSAFDVITSLAHRHGRFVSEGDDMRFEAHPSAGDFKIVMHSANGWLPHLQYEQREPFRDIYRHVNRNELLGLTDLQGFLRLETYFDRVCRPALTRAFQRDRRKDIAERLSDPSFNLDAFIEQMTNEHECTDAFAGMRKEFPQAETSVEDDRPIHWKEVLDDLMYTLNFHAERMPAEDHLRLHEQVMPFLMNVIAALPLESARTLLALHDAGRLELIAGYGEVLKSEDDQTIVQVDCNGDLSIHRYKMLVDCSGQQPLDIGSYSFASLVEQGTVRVSRAQFADPSKGSELDAENKDRLINDRSGVAIRLEGIDIDESFRVIGADGESNPRIYEMSFPHTTGMRPYSYGLQACNDTARIVVVSLLNVSHELSMCNETANS